MNNTKYILLFLGMLLSPVFAQEICDNAIDDDFDGLIDLNDPDCDCASMIDLSVIPNPSFEDRSCCPADEAELFCADFWEQASDATSDYYNLCDFSSFGFVGSLPVSTPLPGGGEGFVGLYNFLTGYREYVGACTIGPLLAGVSYTLNFHTAYSYGSEETFEFKLYGTPDCTDLPWEGITCPEGIGGWELLAAENITYVMDASWQEVSVMFTPTVDIEGIAFGGPCGSIGDTDGSYYYFDELLLVESEIAGYIESVNGWCSEDPTLFAYTEDLGGTWQWYKEGVALLGETNDNMDPTPYGEGTYSALYTYDLGCKRMSYTSPLIPTSSFLSENVCLGEVVNFTNTSSGDLSLDIPYKWIFADGFTEESSVDPSHLYNDPGAYLAQLVAYSEDASCTDTSTNLVTVGAKPVVDFSLSGDHVIWTGTQWIGCANLDIVLNDLTTIDGDISFASWEWSFGDGNTSSEQNPVIQYENDGDYNVQLIVVAENGCIDSTDQLVGITKVTADFTVIDSLCQGIETVFTNTSLFTAGTGLDSLRWILGEPLDTLSAPSTTFLYEEGGEYEANLYVESNLGCFDSITKVVLIHPRPNPDFYADKNPTDYFDTDLELIIIYPDPESSYYWSLPGGDPANSVENRRVQVMYPKFEVGTYPVLLIETSEFGCVDSVEKNIVILEDELLYAPTAFTPNGDPYNAGWRVYAEGFNWREFDIRIFNRWGELVWQGDAPEDVWDGTYPNGSLVIDDTYIWYVKGRDQINDEIFEFRGFVTVLK